ncbi:transcriptional regulator, HxlR family [Methanocaldococcus sp. FS406-22]|uniref:winged helix-turn-helix transcriptional regulator n=1 Tax=Methanocaldococcus sp. (strain FS406-22) TaxID=644281 RepID=UPI0001BF3517|nr:helix-turn-helix transcriptional regulator [Methanocaldococcus sp. FS406-22]ADC69785.1 transcriptional regulator, HxlR family [Methanocaldococcus sp. FS406-22]
MEGLIKLLAKKHVKEILQYLDTYGEVHFGQLHKDLGIHKGTLGNVLEELVDAGLLNKRREDTGTLLPRTYYSLTDFGRKVLILMRAINMLGTNPNIEVYQKDNKIIVAI